MATSKKRTQKKSGTKAGPGSWQGIRDQAPQRSPGWGLGTALFANLMMVAPALYAGYLDAKAPEAYYRSVQEDEWLEWGTFWGFALAAAIFLLAALWQRRGNRSVPWFYCGLALFCFVVAMEEISWAQRVFGYRPPSYFLSNNFQQEFNVHNIIATTWRKRAMWSLLAGYGVAFPVLGNHLGPALRRTCDRLGLWRPPLALAPGFLITLLIYIDYPWKFTGEVVELMMAFGFLFAAIAAASSLRPAPVEGKVEGEGEGEARTRKTNWARGLLPLAAASALVLALGLANASTSQAQRIGHPDTIATTQAEVDALKADFLKLKAANRNRFVTRCGLHKRLYSYVEKYDREELLELSFADLTSQGMPEERASFFLDPWNSPYWIRHKCDDDREKKSVFVYSFGPNRKRDSTAWELLGDDVGAILLKQ